MRMSEGSFGSDVEVFANVITRSELDTTNVAEASSRSFGLFPAADAVYATAYALDARNKYRQSDRWRREFFHTYYPITYTNCLKTNLTLYRDRDNMKLSALQANKYKGHRVTKYILRVEYWVKSACRYYLIVIDS